MKVVNKAVEVLKSKYGIDARIYDNKVYLAVWNDNLSDTIDVEVSSKQVLEWASEYIVDETIEECMQLYKKICDAFNSQSGGDYNDTMYYQMKGAEMDIEEGQWEDILPNLKQCWEFVKVCLQRDKKMQRPDWDNMPDEIYG